MKIFYSHIKRNIISDITINELSEKLFQLGHEHEISNDVIDFELTPNRGDCLSIKGLLRDLNQFYEIAEEEIYENDLGTFSLNFYNNAEEYCKNISFLKIEIDDIPTIYNGELADYFIDLNINKNNFFTDISNYISYETGQPTHCYDLSKIDAPIKLDFLKEDKKFDTLLGQEILTEKDSLVFFDNNDQIINLAGIVGGLNTSCSNNTKSVLVECAHFNPEIILGKALKYGLNSDAAHKFERYTDPECHESILRRFIKIVEKHSTIKNVEIYTQTYENYSQRSVKFDPNKINKILGTSIEKIQLQNILLNFQFSVDKDTIFIPSHRNDIETINDIAEEVARAVGYDSIKPTSLKIVSNPIKEESFEEKKLKNILLDNGFYEVINDPFVAKGNKKSIVVDNPLDSNRKFLRTELKNSLLKNLLYNERRQKDSVKLFEISDIYSSDSASYKRFCGIIASGRVGKNYEDFQKRIDTNYLNALLSENLIDQKLEVINISRDSIDSKIKDKIVYLEIEINEQLLLKDKISKKFEFNINNKHYEPVSDFPCSKRDLSFLVQDFYKCNALENLLLSLNITNLKEVFVFDYYENKKSNEIKIGFRFIFQSKEKTMTDIDVNKHMDKIILDAINLGGIKIPGLKNNLSD